MTKLDHYRQTLRTLADWDSFLMAESGLPGPRGNLELAQAVADLGDAALFHRYLALADVPPDSPRMYLVFCGVVGLGRMLAEGDRQVIPLLRRFAADPCWRIREAVCLALQRWGQRDMDALIAEMQEWSRGSCYEQRAAAAALCEPALLVMPDHTRAVLDILDGITASLAAAEDRRKQDDFIALRKTRLSRMDAAWVARCQAQIGVD